MSLDFQPDDIDFQLEEEPKKKKEASLGDLWSGIRGTASLAGDMAMAVPRIGSQVALTTAAKLANPSYNIDELWKASGEEIGNIIPTMGQQFGGDQDLPYKVGMYPFEKYGEAIDWVADKIPNKDVAGAIKMAGAVAPLPFAGRAAKLGERALAKIDPGIRNLEYRKPINRPVVEEAPVAQKPVGEQMELPLENSVQQVAEMRAAKNGQLDLFGPTNHGELAVGKVSPEEALPPVSNEMQGTLPFETSVEQIAAKQAEGQAQGDMFVKEDQEKQAYDPVIEKQKFEQQETVRQEVKKYLEEQKKQQDVEVAYKQREEQKQQQLQQELSDIKSSSLDLKEHQLRNESPRKINVPRNQRGAINMAVFDEGFRAVKELGNGIKLLMEGGEAGPIVRAMRGEQEVGRLGLTADEWFSPKPKSNFQAAWVDTHGAPKTGLSQEMYKFASEQGDIVPSKAQTSAGKEMWNRFEKEGVSQGMKIPRSQRGAINFTNLSDTFKKLAGLNAKSPEVVKASGDMVKDKQRAAVSNIIPGLEPFRPTINTPEKVVASALLPNTKDLTMVQKATASSVKPGIRKVRIATNNPLVNFVGEATAKVFTQAEHLTRQYITGKTGIGKLFNELSDKELTEVHKALMAADKSQTVLTPEQLQKAGYSKKQVEFINKYYEMDKAKLDLWNEKLLETGQQPVKERVGHLPGIFTGDYKSLVLDEKGSPVGFVGTDTKWGHNLAVTNMKEKFPNYTFTEMKRAKLGGNGPRSDMFSGVRDLMQVLAANDPAIARVLEATDAVNARNANSLYNADKHALDKKGIWGNEGNKPWQTDQSSAAKDFFKAYFRHWEEGTRSHLNMPVEAQIKGLLNNPALDHMPRAKEYVNEYIQNMTGRSVGEVGSALNTLLDLPGKVLGIGPNISRQVINQVNKRLGQQTMGWFNLPFLATQYLQLAQTAIPEFASVGNKVGKGIAEQTKASSNAISLAIKLSKENISGEPVKMSPEERAAVEYAKERGLVSFSEFHDANTVGQGKFARKYDKVADFTRQLGESGTRPLVFFNFVELLKDTALPKEEMFDTAYNLTQDAMVDYSNRERPLMFQKMGVAGQLAGGLQTFKFSYLDQMFKWGKEAKKGNLAPLVTGLMVALTYSGVQGLPFYQEADELMKSLSNKFYGKEQSIGETALKNLPDWAKYGGMSAATGVNAQTRLSAADVLPNSVAEAVSPYAGQLTNMASAVGEAVQSPDALAARNLGMAFAPSSLRGPMENMFATDEKNTYLNKRNEREYPRTQFDRNVRWGNMASLEEFKTRQKLNENKNTEKADLDRKTTITGLISRGVKVEGSAFTKSDKYKQLQKEYLERKGTPDHLDDIILNALLEQRKTAKQRAEGVPSDSLSSIYKYRYYNK